MLAQVQICISDLDQSVAFTVLNISTHKLKSDLDNYYFIQPPMIMLRILPLLSYNLIGQ